MKLLMPWLYMAAATATQVSVAYAGHGSPHRDAQGTRKHATSQTTNAGHSQRSPLGLSSGVEDYRGGHYFQALQHFSKQSKYDAVEAYYLAQMNLYGYGELKNNQKALHLYTQAGEGGFLPAQEVMARYMLLEKNDPITAFYWFKKSADANDVQAQLYVAAAYLFGYGVSKNPDKARQYYIGAAKQGSSIAQYAIAEYFIDSRHAENRKLGLIWLDKALAQHNPKAQLLMSRLYAEGKLYPKSMEKAVEWADLAVAQGYPAALVQKGNLALDQQDVNAAKEAYTKAADMGYVPGELALGQLYLDKKSSLYDVKKGYLWVLKAAQNDLPEAQRLLSDLYQQGVHGEIDQILSKEWQLKAAKNPGLSPAIQAAKWLSNDKSTDFASSGYRLKGIFTDWNNADAQQQNQYNPAPKMVKITRDMLYKPQFVLTTPDQIPVSDYYDALAASMGDLGEDKISFYTYPLDETLTALKEALSSKEPDATETAKQMIAKIQLEASLGNSVAEFELGQIYQHGMGVTPDPMEAIRNYEIAAGQDDPVSMYALGILYLEGSDGLAADAEKGLSWLNKAAFRGNANAQFALAQVYEKGLKNKQGELIVKPNPEQAEGMYFLAAANHNGLAQYRLAERLVRKKQENASLAEKQARQVLIKSLYQGAIANHVAEAALPLAFFNAMDTDKEKQTSAFKVAKEEADKGNPNAALLLGLLYDRGIGVPASQEDAVEWYQKAGNNLVSQFVLGTYYSLGTVLSQDIDKGRALLQESADAQFSYANLNLAVLQQQQGVDFLPQLDKALALGNAKAGLLLADYYLSLASNEAQMQQARDIYLRFAEKGDKDAQLKLAYMHELGLGGQFDAQSAFKWYSLAAEQGQPMAQYLLGRLYQFGALDAMPNYALAKQWYSQAQSTYSPAAVALGFVYDTVDSQYQQAQASYQVAADLHDPIGQYNLGLIYEEGKGQAVDQDKALALYQQAADQGLPQAMVRLAGIYFNGSGSKSDPMLALDWYKKAADKGDRDAYYLLGLLSEAGVTTKINYADALHYYEKSAELGNQKGMLAAARMYQYGMGVEKNKPQAEVYYKMLADLGNVFAKQQLAALNDSMLQVKSTAGAETPAVKLSLNTAKSKTAQVKDKRAMQPQPLLSVVEPVSFRQAEFISGRPVELLYLDALNQWNVGDNEQSKYIFERIRNQFPDFIPARRTYERMSLG